MKQMKTLGIIILTIGFFQGVPGPFENGFIFSKKVCPDTIKYRVVVASRVFFESSYLNCCLKRNVGVQYRRAVIKWLLPQWFTIRGLMELKNRG